MANQFCQHCGAGMEPNATFCQSCGKAQTPASAAPVYTPAPQPQYTHNAAPSTIPMPTTPTAGQTWMRR